MDRYKLQKILEWLRQNQGDNPFRDWGGRIKPKPWPMPGDSRRNPDWGRLPKWPPSEWPPKGVKPVPFPEIELDPDRVKSVPMPRSMPGQIPDWWNRGEKFPLDTGPRKEWWDKRMPYFPREGDDWQELLSQAQAGSAMPKLHKSIDPLSQYPHYGGTSRGLRREKVSGAEAVKEFEERATGPQLGGVPESDRKFVDTMHRIQNAYFTGADFGYEEGWTDHLGSTQEQIDMFMAVPEEAIKHAMDNPTDAVLQEFEEYYGFPLNVNDPDMQKYFEDRKKKRPRG